MKNFLKMTLAVIVGSIITTLLFGFLFFVIIAGIVSANSTDEVNIDSATVLYLTLDQPIPDRGSSNIMDNLSAGNFGNFKQTGLEDYLKCIEKAKKDKNIKGIYLELSTIPSGMATVEEIRNALLDFKTSGKFIIAYSDGYNHKSYYVATVADKIYLTPTGMVMFTGLSAQIMFFKKAMEKIGVQPEIIRHGKFKSAVEPFLLEKMSTENREQTSVYLNSFWNTMLNGISKQRGITVEQLNTLADNLTMKNDKAALENKLVDALYYKDQVIDELKKLTGTKESDDINVVKINKYKKVPEVKEKSKEKFKLVKDKIAVIYASGEIVDGKGGNDQIGGESLSRTIREARRDSSIKAIVLRVNSPGGSALASEIIYREVVLAKKDKPVIVSMGDLAASGGYYIACMADVIVCNPNTITGSIGVFGLMFNAQKLLNEKIGISVDVVNTNKHSDLGNMLRPMQPEERDAIQFAIEDIYDTFIGHVAEGRNMTKAQVDSIGQGRVWSGENAIKIGLVDTLAGLDAAIKIAQRKAKLDKFRIVSMPEEEDPFKQFMDELADQAKARIINNTLGETYQYYNNIQQALNRKGIQTRIPYDVWIY